MTELTAENLNIDITDSGQITIEPSYVGFLRSQGYIIEAIQSVHAVPSESGEGSHIVVEIQTYEYPRNHPKLDYIEHERILRACDCWSYRNSSGDPSDGENIGGSCKHIKQVYREEKAKADDQQIELV